MSYKVFAAGESDNFATLESALQTKHVLGNMKPIANLRMNNSAVVGTEFTKGRKDDRRNLLTDLYRAFLLISDSLLTKYITLYYCNFYCRIVASSCDNMILVYI